jgi:DNA mismatch repair protein MutS
LDKLTPMMQQYVNIKSHYPDAILFFRLGDFYEMFFEDAELASKILEIALTARDGGEKRVPMCGVPYHAADGYIAKLVARGFKVAICEQVEDPKTAKGIVKREVTRVITPGTIIDDKVLVDKQNNYLMALADNYQQIGLAYVDISTGELYTTAYDEFSAKKGIIDEIARLSPAECLICDNLAEDYKTIIEKNNTISKYAITVLNEELSLEEAKSLIEKQFPHDEFARKSFKEQPAVMMAVGILLLYLQETQKNALQHLTKIRFYYPKRYMNIDPQTRRNLELTVSLRSQERYGSLLHILDETKTAMGGRKLKQWIEQPLLDEKAIKDRLDAVEELVNEIFLRSDLKKSLKGIYDFERILAKTAYNTVNARDLLALKQSLAALEQIKKCLEKVKSTGLSLLAFELELFPDLVNLLDKALNPDPPLTIREGGIIKENFNQRVDELRKAAKNGKSWIAKLEAEERERTGIKSLKIGFNKVFGYYIDVTKANLDLVPKDYIRKQTLANSERYITPKLKELEDLVLNSQERLRILEYEIFTSIREEVSNYISKIQKAAQIVAELDVLVSFAECAIKYNYVKPSITSNLTLKLTGARHPVVEQLNANGFFVPNDCLLDTSEHQLAIITGPNMAGKSTYIRTVALIAIMAQMGSFVPADEAVIGLVDRVFARVGASDDLATGQSTFMVEMNEVANILQNATKKSLIILDEVGRGTSTFDGLSIAWSICEYLVENIRARTLFATHYHELIELENIYPAVKNYSMAVKEHKDEVVFLRKVIPGGSDRSYGIHVAKLAGLPSKVLDSAYKKLRELEQEKDSGKTIQEIAATKEENKVIFKKQDQEVLEILQNLQVDNVAPREALNLLYDLKEKLSCS